MKICANHTDYEVPLIWTFAFPGAEYWCAYCGNSTGMLGEYEDVEETRDLLKRLKKYEKRSRKFLHANASLVADSIKYEGKRITPDDLPQEEKDKDQKIRDEWEYHIKI